MIGAPANPESTRVVAVRRCDDDRDIVAGLPEVAGGAHRFRGDLAIARLIRDRIRIVVPRRSELAAKIRDCSGDRVVLRHYVQPRAVSDAAEEAVQVQLFAGRIGRGAPPPNRRRRPAERPSPRHRCTTGCSSCSEGPGGPCAFWRPTGGYKNVSCVGDNLAWILSEDLLRRRRLLLRRALGRPRRR